MTAKIKVNKADKPAKKSKQSSDPANWTDFKVGLVHLSPNVDTLLGKAQVCAALGFISVRTLQEMVSTGQFPPCDTKIGVLPRWHAATINHWIKEQCEGSRKKKE